MESPCRRSGRYRAASLDRLSLAGEHRAQQPTLRVRATPDLRPGPMGRHEDRAVTAS